MAVTIQGSAGVTTNSGAVYDGLQTGTAVTASGTAVNFDNIPSWVERITVMLAGVSTSGSSSVLIQVGSGSFTTSGYLGTSIIIGTAGAVTNLSSGFRLFFNTSDVAAVVRHGSLVLTKLSNNVWTASGTIGLSDSAWISIIGGSISLSSTLDRLRVTTVNGTDTFDAGTINIMYE